MVSRHGALTKARHRKSATWAALFVMVLPTACTRGDIQEDGRNAIRRDAQDAMETFQRVVSTTDTKSREQVEQQLKSVFSALYAVSWSLEGDLSAEIYLREHLTRGGGWFAEQRTVQACVKYIAAKEEFSMRSVPCSEKAPLLGTVDEDVSVP